MAVNKGKKTSRILRGDGPIEDDPMAALQRQMSDAAGAAAQEAARNLSNALGAAAVAGSLRFVKPLSALADVLGDVMEDALTKVGEKMREDD